MHDPEQYGPWDPQATLPAQNVEPAAANPIADRVLVHGKQRSHLVDPEAGSVQHESHVARACRKASRLVNAYPYLGLLDVLLELGLRQLRDELPARGLHLVDADLLELGPTKSNTM